MMICRSNWTAEHHAALAGLARGSAGLARLLSVPPEELPQRLAYNALHDPAPGVRLQNLRFLVAPETQAPLELLVRTTDALLADAHPPVRLLAAEHSDVRGLPALRAMATGRALELGLRLQALHSLARPPLSDLDGVRAVLLDAPPPELACAALSLIGANADGAILDAVLSQAASDHDDVRAAAARALGVLARPHTEPLLISLLSDRAVDVQQASAEALGTFASVAAVEPLLPLAENLVRPRLRQTARGAIGRIQSRLGDVAAGRLSLSDPRDLAGALELVDTSAAVRIGELSLADEVTDGQAALGAEPTEPAEADGASDARARAPRARNVRGTP